MNYTWTTDVGTISGISSTANVDTTRLSPGIYWVKGHVTQGPKSNQNADCAVEFVVKASSAPAQVVSDTVGTQPATPSVGSAETECKYIKQPSAVGTRCKTSVGFWFARVENGWKEDNRKMWYDDTATNINQYDAEESCINKGQTLPSDLDFRLAVSHGIVEVFKDMRDSQNSVFWSSSVDSEFAHVFESSRGYHFEDHRPRASTNAIWLASNIDPHSSTDPTFFARCVSR